MAGATMERTDAEALLEPLREQWAVLLRTRKRDGSWVATPVNLAVEGDRAYFGTPAGSGKVKRLRNFDAVELAPCTPRGKPTGVSVAARARRLEGEEAAAARARMVRKYPFVHRFLVPLELRLKRVHEVHYELDRFRPLEGRDTAPGVGAAQLADTLAA
ncbi:MAG TPA: PPOX class F420-dependent oxidoreductase [Solirubrobacterales bacterium]|nr:PPOX class F420-dependent oxidoreductase [Solirubrobacterales bacterium]